MALQKSFDFAQLDGQYDRDFPFCSHMGGVSRHPEISVWLGISKDEGWRRAFQIEGKEGVFSRTSV
jgi:hypothetical protein